MLPYPRKEKTYPIKDDKEGKYLMSPLEKKSYPLQCFNLMTETPNKMLPYTVSEDSKHISCYSLIKCKETRDPMF